MTQRDCPKGHRLPPNPPEGLCPECLLLLAVPEHPTEIDGFRIERARSKARGGVRRRVVRCQAALSTASALPGNCSGMK